MGRGRHSLLDGGLQVRGRQKVKVAIELHPGFIGYHTESFWRLREIGGDALGVNFDPSHLFWQDMDPLVCIRELDDATYHVHMKDTWLDQQNIWRNGVLDTKPYTEEKDRSWIFRTVGYGHGQEFWRAMVSELRLAGYDGALSIEHEDSLMSIDEGFAKADEFLKGVVIREQPGAAWWAKLHCLESQPGLAWLDLRPYTLPSSTQVIVSRTRALSPVGSE